MTFHQLHLLWKSAPSILDSTASPTFKFLFKHTHQRYSSAIEDATELIAVHSQLQGYARDLADLSLLHLAYTQKQHYTVCDIEI